MKKIIFAISLFLLSSNFSHSWQPCQFDGYNFFPAQGWYDEGEFYLYIHGEIFQVLDWKYAPDSYLNKNVED